MLHLPGPTKQELLFWGLTEDEATPTADVWPDNIAAVNVFMAAMGQWRVGFGGAYALDYNVFPIVAKREYESPEWPEIFEDVRVMEESALETLRKREKNG